MLQEALSDAKRIVMFWEAKECLERVEEVSEDKVENDSVLRESSEKGRETVKKNESHTRYE